MKLAGEHSHQLYEALISAFPERASLEQMLKFHLDQNLNEIAGEGNLRAVIFDVIQWAEAKNRVPDLLAAAREANPENTQLCSFAIVMQKISDAEEPESPTSLKHNDDMPPAFDLESLLNLCDRGPEARQFIVSLKDGQRQSREKPQIHLIFAQGVDEPEDFVERLVQHDLRVALGKDKGSPLYRELDWPRDGIEINESPQSLVDHLKEQIFRKLARAPKKLQRELETNGQEVLNSSLERWVNVPLVVVSLTINPEGWGRNSEELLFQLLDFWSHQTSSRTLFVLLINFVYPTSQSGLSWLTGFLRALSMKGTAGRLKGYTGAVHCYQEVKLKSVPRHEAEIWLDERGLITDGEERDIEMRKLFGRRRAMRMRPLKHKLREVYKRIRPGGSNT